MKWLFLKYFMKSCLAISVCFGLIENELFRFGKVRNL